MLDVEKTESAIEVKFVEIIGDSLADGIELEPQVEMYTRDGNFRGDFVVRAAGRVVLIECDGRKFHDYAKDRRRDCLILSDTDVTDVLRLRGCDLFFDEDGTRAKVELCLPSIFDADRRPIIEDVSRVPALGLAFLQGLVKPIFRTLIPLCDVRREWSRCAGVTVMGRVPDKNAALLQFQNPHWDWKYEGDKVWRIGDALRMEMEALS